MLKGPCPSVFLRRDGKAGSKKKQDNTKKHAIVNK